MNSLIANSHGDFLEGFAKESLITEEEAKKELGVTTATPLKVQQPAHNKLLLHALHRRRLYKEHALHLSSLAERHYFYRLLMWCHDRSVFIHPALQMVRQRSTYRQHAFHVKHAVRRLTPLLAIPEHLAIGFQATCGPDGGDSGRERNSLFDEQRERDFHHMNVGDDSDADVCQFFFSALGAIVADLVTAKSSPLTDPRHTFASLLSKVQTIPNAPYFDEGVVFDAVEPCLADVLLQMIRNYINGGPLVNKLSRDELQWAVSVCLSHATPLQIHTLQSIGIIPLVHLFPHGGTHTNSYVIARNAREHAAAKMAAYFRETSGYDFAAQYSGKWIYVVCDRELEEGDEVCLQAMAPVCDRDTEAEQMWRLSCGTAPPEYMASAAVAQKQLQLTQEIIDEGSKFFKHAQ